MGHGGSRDGSGRKPKYGDNPDTKNKRVPRNIPNHLIDRWIFILIDVENAGFDINTMSVDDIIKIYMDMQKP